MFIGLDYIGVAVKSLDGAINIYRSILCFKFLSVYILTERRMKVTFSTAAKPKSSFKNL
ncbi:MAG: hypothetical protein QXJ07_05360 [Candidatus Bathyarchaeia archaeon]